MQVIYITYDGLTDPLGRSQILPYLIELSKKGFKIHIISFEKKKSLHTPDQIKGITEANGISWKFFHYSNRPPIISTIFNLLKLYFNLKKTLDKNDVNLIHCRSYLSTLVASRLKSKYNFKLLFDMRGFWPDERVDGNLWSMNSMIFRKIYSYFKRREIDLCQHADHIVSLTNRGKQLMVSGELFNHHSIQHQNNDIRIDPDKISVIPCCVDMSLFDPTGISKSDKIALRTSLNLSDVDKVMSYLGSIGTWYLLSEMLNFYKKYCEEHPNTKFFFITGDDSDSIMAEARKLHIPVNNIVIKKAPREKVPLFLSISDVSVFFIKPAFSKSASSPTKQGELMSMGIPVICNEGIGDTDEIVKKYNAGSVIDLGKPLSGESFSISNFNKNLVRKGAEEYFSLEKGVDTYHDIYKALILT